MDESFGPLAPRNIYGVTKLAAEALCRVHFLEYGLNCVVLRTGRFFPEEDDTQRELSGPNRLRRPRSCGLDARHRSETIAERIRREVKRVVGGWQDPLPPAD